jgi:hypothetical protein
MFNKYQLADCQDFYTTAAKSDPETYPNIIFKGKFTAKESYAVQN